jgi:hypothetical protein
MKFQPLSKGYEIPGNAEEEFRSSRAIGPVRIGAETFYFKKGRTAYFIPYENITRVFRRVLLVPAKMGCCAGDLPVEHIVICDGSGELAQIQLPGEKAGKALLEELKKLIPDAQFGKPGAQAPSEA